MIIVPDRTCTGLEASGYNYYCNFTDKPEYRKAEELSKGQTKLQTSKKEGYSSDFRMRILQRNNGMSMALLSKLLFYYGGIILLIICFTLLSLQQLADSSDFKHRFMIIKKMGISNPSLNKIVLGQMGIWFGLPILLAVISALGTSLFIRVIFILNYISAWM